MREKTHHFKGRGHRPESDEDSLRIIECTAGTVLAICVQYCGTYFVLAYCRKAMIDRWDVYCANPFNRASDVGLTRSWAEPYRKGLFLFRQVCLEIVNEQDWMTRTE